MAVKLKTDIHRIFKIDLCGSWGRVRRGQEQYPRVRDAKKRSGVNSVRHLIVPLGWHGDAFDEPAIRERDVRVDKSKGTFY